MRQSRLAHKLMVVRAGRTRLLVMNMNEQNTKIAFRPYFFHFPTIGHAQGRP